MMTEKSQHNYSGFVEGGLSLISHGVDSPYFEIIHSTPTSVIWTGVVSGKRRVYKSLADSVSEKEPYRRLLRKEFDIMTCLSHPGIVSVIGFVSYAGIGEAVEMEWIDGSTIDGWLATSPDINERRRVVEQIMDAVSYMHSKGVVHRDIKPANIMITHDGSFVKIIDFGLADTVSHVELKNPAGTEGYMSVHQKQSFHPLIADDIYALRVVTGEILPEDARWISTLSGVDSVRELLRRLQHRWGRALRRRLRVSVITGALLLASGIWLIAFTLRSSQSRQLETHALELQRTVSYADSLHAREVASLTDSIVMLSGKLAAEHGRRDMVTGIIESKTSELRAIWRRPISQDVMIDEQTRLGEGSQLIRKYISANSDRLTDVELASVETALTNRQREFYEQWLKTQYPHPTPVAD
ncbi:MAG: protein kinase [Paramuribaculum sp.]|nr:protein kinase [Paramuribaculum sp.]